MARLSVLQIEASESDAARIEKLLQRAGYEVDVKCIRTEAQLRLALETEAWDVITCDHVSQFEAGAALRVVRASALDIPFIVVSRAMSDDEAAALMKSGAHDYIGKDNLARLVPAIEREIEQVASRRRRAEADEELRAAAERLTLALAASQMGVWEWDLKTNAVYWSDECFAITGSQDFNGTLDSFLRLVHPLDVGRVWGALETAIAQRGILAAEFRILSGDRTLWISNFAKVKTDAHGQPVRLIGTVQDITARKQAQETLQGTNQELQELNGNYRALLSRLHSISEEERAHLSREIHDEFGQSLTTLKINAHGIEQALRRGEIGTALRSVSTSTANINGLMQAVRDIATELRPPMLDQLGLAAALEWQIGLLSEQHGLEIELDLPPSEPDLNEIQRIAAFRIAQESLTNVVRHASTKSVKLTLADEENVVRLTIEDRGTGFEPREHLPGSLGIFGMRERARLIDASFSIRTNPGQGVTVELIIPKSVGPEVPSR